MSNLPIFFKYAHIVEANGCVEIIRLGWKSFNNLFNLMDKSLLDVVLICARGPLCDFQ